MKGKLFFCLILFTAMACFIGSGCGSSSTSESDGFDHPITSEEGAYITRDDILHDNTVVMDTENSGVSCDSSGDNCYNFSTRYNVVGSQTSVAVIDSSGHRFFFEFVSRLAENTLYEYIPNIDFMNQRLKMYVSYDSPELQCGEGCSNVYNYSDMESCSETCKYFKVQVLENSEDYLEFEFRIWNLYFLDFSEVQDNDHRGATFAGHIKIKKKLHRGADDYYHTPDDE